MDDLLQEFIAETRETLEALSGEIVAWEADPSDRARLDSIFRFVHTVKGSCGFLDLPRLSRLSHAAEDVLSAARDGTRSADPALVNAVLAIVDRIGEIVEAIDAGVALDDTSDDLLIAALEKNAVAATLVTTSMAMRAPTRSVRLSVDLLDRMMGGMSDMVLARNELARRLRTDGGDPATEAALERLSATVAEMRDTVSRTRMQTIDALFSALPRMVRDTAASVGKAVSLTIDGADVELDRELIEMMRDPLVHIIRNAIDHGIEAPADRRKAGKRESGRLAVSARQSGNRIIVEIVDDGRGIDTDRLVAKTIAQDPRREPELRRMSERQRLDLVFEPGLSSRDEVTAISGRGVGMDVVRANIEQLGGRIELDNRPGSGLTLAIHVPLTLAILSAVVVGVSGTCFALPRQAIDEIIAMRSPAIRIDRVGAQMVVRVRERLMPLIDLGTLMALRGEPSDDATLVIVDVPGGSFALVVDSVLDTEELVVKPAAPAVMAAGLYAGQTLPDSGLPLLLLDCSGIATKAGIRFERVAASEVAVETASAPVGAAALLFRDLDGIRRAVALSAIDRVEQVPAHAIARTGGRLRLTVEDRTVPLIATGEVAAIGMVPVLRLHDDMVEMGYPIAEALEIVTLPVEIASVPPGGAIAGVAVIDGEPTELVDPLWLLASAVDSDQPTAQPLCLLEGSDAGWMEAFLKPALESAGYRVAATLASGEKADVRLAMMEDASVASGGAPVVRLGRRRGEGVYRYDRAELLAAVAASVSGRGA